MMFVAQFIPAIRKRISIDEIFTPAFFSQPRLKVFDNQTLEFFFQISAAILAKPNITVNPELVALAYWLRKFHLTQIHSQFLGRIKENESVVPRGIIFHVAPSNVDSIFLYSWCLSLLAGNINIVRISQAPTEQILLLVDIINEILLQEQFSFIRERNVVLTYEHDEAINAFLSSRSDARVLWGGDRTIQTIRSVQAKPTTKEVTFADKISFTVINAKAILSLNEKEMQTVAKNFYNDVYWFNQKACSSPRIVFFVGESRDCDKAGSLFWQSMQKELQRREAADPASVAMNKLVFAFETASNFQPLQLVHVGKSNMPSVIKVPFEHVNKFRENCGGGFLFQCHIPNIKELYRSISSNDQTMTYFGFTTDELKLFLESFGREGIDRIVPIGEALNFSPVWDGYDILTELTKRVVIK